MEYKYLAHLTGRKKYFDKVRSFIHIGYPSSQANHGLRQVERVMELMYSADLKDDKFPTKWLVSTGQPSNGTRESGEIFSSKRRLC